MELLSILLIFAGLLVGWCIGANSGANCMGTSVGAGIMSYRKAALIVGFFAILGATFQGVAPMITIGKGIIVPTDITLMATIAALLGAALSVIVFTLFGLPVSTTQVIIGSIAGIGIVVVKPVNWHVFSKIFAWGFGSFAVSLAISFLIYKFILGLFSKGKFIFIERKIYILVIVSAAFLAYSLGANNIGLAMGLIVSNNLMRPALAGLVGGIALAFGASTLGIRVMRTIGMRITTLDATMAFSAQFSAAIIVYALALAGIPTSTTFAIVGGVVGVGLVKGIASVDGATIKRIAFGWLATPLIGALFAVLLFKLITFLF